jgi:hypothetical protein
MAAVDKGLRPDPAASQGGGGMAPILTPEDVVRRIAAECTFIDERGAVGIRLEPAAAIVRQYGSNSAHHCSGGPARRNRRCLCFDWPVVFWGSF